jgi:hypothetical protein
MMKDKCSFMRNAWAQEVDVVEKWGISAKDFQGFIYRITASGYTQHTYTHDYYAPRANRPGHTTNEELAEMSIRPNDAQARERVLQCAVGLSTDKGGKAFTSRSESQTMDKNYAYRDITILILMEEDDPEYLLLCTEPSYGKKEVYVFTDSKSLEELGIATDEDFFKLPKVDRLTIRGKSIDFSRFRLVYQSK